MITFQSVFGWISTVLSIACLVWLLGLGVFVFVRSIVLKVKAKKEMKQDLQDVKKLRNCRNGSDEDDEW